MNLNLSSQAALARWRRIEKALEVDLDPEIAKRLDDLRVEDARLLGRTPVVRAVDPVERVPEPRLERTG